LILINQTDAFRKAEEKRTSSHRIQDKKDIEEQLAKASP
jgi:hypothetical protein